MLYGHGDDFYNAKNEVKINFSSNVWHGANLDKLKEHLIEHFDKLTRYPEPDAATLKRLLARRYEIKEENIVVTNGSITAFYLLAQAWRGAKSMIAIFTIVRSFIIFTVYRLGAKIIISTKKTKLLLKKSPIIIGTA